MLVILKRGGILFIVLLLIVSFLICALYTPDADEAAAAGAEVIVIDAGHGAPDGGAVGTKTGVLEKDLNLAISRKLSQKLAEAGERVLMTREEDNGLYTEKEATLRAKKQADMKRRVALANTEGNLCLVSIHMNHFTDAKYSGPQIFYAAGSEDGKRLAEEIRQSILAEIGPHCTREIKPSDNLYLLRQTKIPAVIVECGFLSNAEEEALLIEEGYQDALAAAICSGIQSFKKTV